MNKDLVSIIVPVYNVEKTIEECLNSIKNQLYTNIEVLLIDDGSPDNSGKICDLYSEKDSRFKTFHIENGGVSNARNLGLTKSTGKYIMFVDSDDIVNNDFVSKMVNKMNQGYQIVTCGYKIFLANSNSFIPNTVNYNSKEKYVEDLQEGLLFNQIWNKIYLSDVIKKNNIIFDKTISIAEDWKFNIEYLKYIDSFSICNETLYNYRITNTGLGFKYNKDSNTIKLDLVRKMKTNIYNNKNTEYISKLFITQYYSYFSNIINKRNSMTKKEKKELSINIINSDYYDNDLKDCSISSIKYKVLLKVLLSKKYRLINIFAKLASIYDKKRKNKIYGIK